MPASLGEKNHTHIWTLLSPRYTLRGAWLHACGWWVGGWPGVCVQLATPAIRCDRARTAPDQGDHHGPLKETISLMQDALSRSLPFVVSGGSHTAARTTDYLLSSHTKYRCPHRAARKQSRARHASVETTSSQLRSHVEPRCIWVRQLHPRTACRSLSSHLCVGPIDHSS